MAQLDFERKVGRGVQRLKALVQRCVEMMKMISVPQFFYYLVC